MKRLHAFEFTDMPWCPNIVRSLVTEFLHYFLNFVNIYKPIVPIIADVLRKNNIYHIVDLCSGGSGPLIKIRESLEKELNRQVTVTLSDKYPNLSAFEHTKKITNGRIDFISESVDAKNVPDELHGMRTLFEGLHHFRPSDAKDILCDAVRKGVPIGIFEVTARKPRNILIYFFIPIAVMLFTIFIRPFKLSRFYFTYGIPIAPIVLIWDGMVSNLRTHSVDELKEMVSHTENDGYYWDINNIVSKGFYLTYAVGYKAPKNDLNHT